MELLASLESFTDPNSGSLMEVGKPTTRRFTTRRSLNAKSNQEVDFDKSMDTAHVIAISAVDFGGNIAIFVRFRKLTRNPKEGEDLNEIQYLWVSTGRFRVSEEELNGLKTTEFKFPINTEN